MTTVSGIKNKVTSNISNLRTELNYNGSELRFEKEDTDSFIVECELFSLISAEMRNNTSYEIIKFSAFNSKETYKFNDDSFLDALRSLYKLSTNNTVKSIISTVGKSKQFTSKQEEVIINEMMKFDSIILSK